MKISVSRLRENIYQMVDLVIKTGQPLAIERNGKTVYLMPAEKKRKLSSLFSRKITLGDSDALISIDWSKEWKYK